MTIITITPSSATRSSRGDGSAAVIAQHEASKRSVGTMTMNTRMTF
jgi:hypothetical protein